MANRYTVEQEIQFFQKQVLSALEGTPRNPSGFETFYRSFEPKWKQIQSTRPLENQEVYPPYMWKCIADEIYYLDLNV
jgi:hypothetical protein